MDIENIKTQMRKGILEYCILSLVLKKPLYTGEIIEKLQNANLIIVEGTLYPILSRFKNDSLIDYYWEESSKGHPRKYFKINTKGIELLENLNSEWNNLISSLRALVDNNN